MAEHPSEALARLNPQDRALLELSVGKGLTDEEIAQVLQADSEEVRRMRDEALRRLADLVGEGDVDAVLRALAESEADHRRETTEPEAEPGRPRRRRAVLIGLLVIAAGAGVGIALAGGGDDDEPDQAATTPRSETTPATDTAPATVTETTPEPEPEPEPAPEPAPKPKPVPVREMEVLNDTHGRGTAQLVTTGRTSVRLAVREFLEPQGGGYAVWLYNSEDNARRLFATRGTDWEREIPLPADYGRYRYIEVARAVPDLNSDHSGLSLLRVAVADLERKG